MGRLIESSRAYLIVFDQYNNYVNNSYEWCKEGVDSREEVFNSFDPKNFLWLTKVLTKEDYIFIKHIDNLSEEAINIKFVMKEDEIESALLYAIKINDKIIGILGFDDPIKAKNFDDESLIIFGVISEIFGNSIERKRTEVELRERKEEYHQEIDRIHFYNELFDQDMNYIFDKMFEIISDFEDNEELGGNPKLEKFLTKIKRESIEGSELVAIIKTLTNLEQMMIMPHQVDIIDLVKKALEKVKNLSINKDIGIEMEYSEEGLTIYGDEILRLVIENILISSIKYNDKKVIDIKIIIFRNQRNNQNYLKIEFVDHQELVSDHRKEEILDKMNKDKNIHGVLLRFLLVERILELLNGEIWVEGGAKFVILLPEVKMN
jgi:signal transduction histidine kinase